MLATPDSLIVRLDALGITASSAVMPFALINDGGRRVVVVHHAGDAIR
jgi:hypothetical protein